MSNPYIAHAQSITATDIYNIDNTIWYRVLQKLQTQQQPAIDFADNIVALCEHKSPTHLRLLPNDLSRNALHYPTEVERLFNLDKGLIIISGSHGSGKTTLLLHLLQNLGNRTLQADINLPTLKNCKWLLSNDQADVHIMELHDAQSSLDALNAASHQLVIAQINAGNTVDAMRKLLIWLSQYPEQLIQDLMADQIKSIVSCALVKTTNQQIRPIIGIAHSNESIRAQIKQGHFHEIEQFVQRGNAGSGSLSFDIQLANLLQSRTISMEEALRLAIEPATMRLRASGIIHND